MSYHYANKKAEADPHTLPDIETFVVSDNQPFQLDDTALENGWYWWTCLPGCMPDSEPSGPFKTEAEALEDAQSDDFGYDE